MYVCIVLYLSVCVCVCVCGWQLFDCNQPRMNEWLNKVCDMRMQDATKVTVGLAEKAVKILAT